MPAPDFSLPDESGRVITLWELKGNKAVLVFYPGDDTPGCTRQLCEFRDRWDALQDRGIAVFGVNPQGAARTRASAQSFHFPSHSLWTKGGRLPSYIKPRA